MVATEARTVCKRAVRILLECFLVLFYIYGWVMLYYRPRVCLVAGTYDAVICVGALIKNNITDVAFPEIIRITKKGNFLLLSILFPLTSTVRDLQSNFVKDKLGIILVDGSTVDRGCEIIIKSSLSQPLEQCLLRNDHRGPRLAEPHRGVSE